MIRTLPRRRVIIALVALLLGAAVGISSSWLMWDRAEQESERADEAVAAAEDLCAQIEGMGWTCVHDPDELRGEAGPAGPAGPPPSDEQVAAAVAEYFEAHPVEDGETPSPAAVAAAVANHLAENPPDQGPPGPGPTASQIATAVEEYLTANPPPPGPPGEDGEDGADGGQGPQGEPGPAPSPAEIAAAIEDYLTEHPLPTCPAGSAAEPITVLTIGVPVEIIACVVQSEEE